MFNMLSNFIGDSHMSPGVLANMWKEEEARTKVLEEKLKLLLRDREVSRFDCTLY